MSGTNLRYQYRRIAAQRNILDIAEQFLGVIPDLAGVEKISIDEIGDTSLSHIVGKACGEGFRVRVEFDKVDAEEAGAEPHDLKTLLKRLDRLAYVDGSEVDYTYVRGLAEEAARAIRHLWAQR